MRIEYVYNEFKAGTTYRRVYLFEDNGDVVMTDGAVYEDELIIDEDDADGDYDGPEDDPPEDSVSP
jgi:hypothetical protein